jgi:hypothetical protein
VLPGKHVTLAADSKPHLLWSRVQPGELVYGVLFQNTGSNPAEIGDGAVEYGGGAGHEGFPIAPGQVLAFDLSGGDAVCGSSAAGTTIAVASTSGRNP